jgi:hypothetical protein
VGCNPKSCMGTPCGSVSVKIWCTFHRGAGLCRTNPAGFHVVKQVWWLARRSKPTPPTDKTTNRAAYKAALKRRGSLTIWFDAEMDWVAKPSGKTGRSQTFSDVAIQTCLTMKVLFGMVLA